MTKEEKRGEFIETVIVISCTAISIGIESKSLLPALAKISIHLELDFAELSRNWTHTVFVRTVIATLQLGSFKITLLYICPIIIPN